MAKPEQIPSDLTLELNGDLSPDRFMTAARAFFGCVQEISRAVVPEGDPPGWVVRAREGSYLLGLDPAPGCTAQHVKAFYASIKIGLDQLTAGLELAADDGELECAPKGPFLPDGAMKHLKTLSDLTEQRSKRHQVGIRLWIEKKPIEIGRQLRNAIVESWGEDYQDYGTIEGKLDAIQDRNNLQIRVYDPVLRYAVACHVEENMLQEVFAGFRKRVEVFGVVHYRRDGMPISIDVESIVELPDDSELPSIDDVRGVLRL